MGEFRGIDGDSSESQSRVEIIDLLVEVKSLGKCWMLDSS
jgi:hypothetical protein